MEEVMEKILAEILTADKNILARRDDLISALDEKVPDNLSRDYTPIKKAINLNVGEIFFVNDLDTAKAEATEILKSSGMQEARINFVIDTFSNAIELQNKKIAEVEQNPEQLAELHQQFINLCKQILLRRQQNVNPLPQQNYHSQPQQIIIQAQPTQNNFPTKTNKILIGVICILAVALFLVTGNNSKTEPEVSELSLGGVELGMTESEVIKILGKPPMVNEGDIASRGYSYEYDDIFIYISRYTNKVIEISTVNSSFYHTKRGIHVGSTYKEMIDAYKNNCQYTASGARHDSYSSYFETSDGLRGIINFDVSNGLVTNIAIRYDD